MPLLLPPPMPRTPTTVQRAVFPPLLPLILHQGLCHRWVILPSITLSRPLILHTTCTHRISKGPRCHQWWTIIFTQLLFRLQWPLEYRPACLLYLESLPLKYPLRLLLSHTSVTTTTATQNLLFAINPPSPIHKPICFSFFFVTFGRVWRCNMIGCTK